MNFLQILMSIVVALLLLVWLGLQVKPVPFPAFSNNTVPADLKKIPLTAGLPTPVERFYRQTYGDHIPVITSAVISGRGTMAPFGLRLPMRFRFIYHCASDYRSLIEATFFGRQVITGYESYINGHALGKMTYGVDEGEWLDQGLNVRIWSEILTWLPAALLTDPRVRWEPVDESMALLVVPFGDKQERIVVRFNSQDGKVQYFEAMKYRKAGEKVLWTNGVWFDQGKPWITLNIEEMLFNMDVHDAILAALS